MFLILPLGKNKTKHLEYQMTSSKKVKTLERWLITIVCTQMEKWNPLISISWFFSQKGMRCLLCNAFCKVTQLAHYFLGLCLFYINVSFTKGHSDRLFSLVHPFLDLQADLYSTLCSSKWNKDTVKQHMQRMLQEIYNANKNLHV